ncbi:MAG: hypothetical protein ACOYJD_01860 [Christensenellales bacterium]|jgi:hypothetical protein
MEQLLALTFVFVYFSFSFLFMGYGYFKYSKIESAHKRYRIMEI